MIELLSIPDKCKRELCIPLNRIFTGEDSYSDDIQSIRLLAVLEPHTADVLPAKSERLRMEEIHFYQVELSSVENIYELAAVIYRKIAYACILLFHYRQQNKWMLSACPFYVGKVDEDKNILRRIACSHWIRANDLSSGGQKMIDAINQLLINGGNISDMYTAIYHEVQYFKLSGLAKTHVQAVCEFLLGAKNTPWNIIEGYCTPYKYYPPKSASGAAQYKRRDRSTRFVFRYDPEDLWYALLHYDKTRRIIENGKYPDIDRLLYRIDSAIYNEGGNGR